MEVKVAKTAGFCFGVQRAVDKVYELIDSCQDRLFTLGPIIHNEEVVNDLEKKGVRVASKQHGKDEDHSPGSHEARIHCGQFRRRFRQGCKQDEEQPDSQWYW